MKSKIEFTKTDECSYDGTNADRYSADDITTSSQTIAKPIVGGSTVKPDCSRHTKEVAGIADMKLLAEMIGNLHYETLDVLMDNIAVKIFKDALKDSSGGRKQLSTALQNASLYIQKSRVFIQEAWNISKPFMSAGNKGK